MRKKIFKPLIVVLNILIIMSLLSGCASPKANSTKSTESNGTNASSKVDVTVGDTSSDTPIEKTPVKTGTASNVTSVSPNTKGAKNAVNSITSTPSTERPNKLPAINVSNKASFKSAVITNLSQGMDLAINLNKQYTKSNISDEVIKVVETSGYAGYVSGIQYSTSNSVANIYFQFKGGSPNFLAKSNEVDIAVKSIVSQTITEDMSDYDKELALHDYVVNNVDYDYQNLLNNTIPEDSYTAYGALIKKVAVCEGYAEAMYKLLNEAGVTCYIINGTGNGVAHQWNLVKIQGGIYHLDATFDDPISTTRKVITHNYFNTNDEEMATDHTWSNYEYPISDAVAANYFTINNLMANNKSKYYEIIKNELINKNPVINIRTSTYEPDIYTSEGVLKVLKDNSGIDYIDTTLGYSFSYDPHSSVIEIEINYK